MFIYIANVAKLRAAPTFYIGILILVFYFLVAADEKIGLIVHFLSIFHTMSNDLMPTAKREEREFDRCWSSLIRGHDVHAV